MKYRHVTIALPTEEFNELEALSEQEERVPCLQAAYFVRQGLRIHREYADDPKRSSAALVALLERAPANKKTSAVAQAANVSKLEVSCDGSVPSIA